MDNLTSWFTSATASGALARTILSFLGMVGMILGVLNMDASWIEPLKEQIGPLLTALAALVYAGTETYRIVFKTSSNKGEAAAHAVDKGLADGDISKTTPIAIKTPEGKPDIPVPAVK